MEILINPNHLIYKPDLILFVLQCKDLFIQLKVILMKIHALKTYSISSTCFTWHSHMYHESCLIPNHRKREVNLHTLFIHSTDT